MKLLLAPLQGFTDAAFRQAFSTHFSGIDTYYAPYVSLQNDGSIRNSQWRDILPERNPVLPVPQILTSSVYGAMSLTNRIHDLGVYKEVNLNLGCPYPMVTRKRRGSGLLPNPMDIEVILSNLLTAFDGKLDFSVKLRCGLADFDEIKEVIPVLNRFDLKYSVLHPRIAKQLYKGNADQGAFADAFAELEHPLYYNGDINTVEDYNGLVERFPKLEGVMMGRGILMNPLLPAEIKRGEPYDLPVKLDLLSDFHNSLFEANKANLSGESHLLSKMQSYIPYFRSFNIDNKKAYKKAKKAKSVDSYLEGMQNLFVV